MADSASPCVKLSSTGTMMHESGASHFYSKHSIIPISDTTEVDEDNRRSSVKLRKLTVLQDGETRFPKLAECAHFHYEYVDFGELELSLDENVELDALSEQWFLINVCSGGRKWVIRRTYESLHAMDKQLHRCIYDRKFSMLPELAKDLIEEEGSVRALGKISTYLSRFSTLADNMINCGPILCWMEIDNRGKRLIVPDNEAPVNIPAVGAAHVVKRYVAQSPDEISLEVGDILSIIEKPAAEESTWWRGKKAFEVGYFPCDYVEVIATSSMPPLVATQPSPTSKPVLHKRGKMTSFLIGFFSSRPNRSVLKQTGIVKERVFGCDLGEHLLNSGQDVPQLLRCCAEVLEEHGIVDGIYRLCGVASNLQKLRNEFDEDRIPDLTSEMYLQDIHCISSLVKMYFRELPNPLLTYQLYDKFTSAIEGTCVETKLIRLREVVRQLPPPHYRTAEFLMRHLSNMAANHKETSMHCRNLAIVWAPNLLRSKDLDPANSVMALKGAGLQAVVTEILIANVDDVFNESCLQNLGLPDEGSVSSLTRPKSLCPQPTATKLLSLEEAQEREYGAISLRQKYISVGAGPAALTSMYHTVIDIPKPRKKNAKKSVSNWRSLFARTHSMTLPSAGNTLGKSSDVNSYAGEGAESLKRMKTMELKDETQSASDLLDGKRLSFSCDVIDSSSLDLLADRDFTLKNSMERGIEIINDGLGHDRLSLSAAEAVETRTSFREKPRPSLQSSSNTPLLRKKELPPKSPMPSFRQGSQVGTKPQSRPSLDYSDKKPLSGLWQDPSVGVSMSSLGSDQLFLDEAESATTDSCGRAYFTKGRSSRGMSSTNRLSSNDLGSESVFGSEQQIGRQSRCSTFQSFKEPLAQSSLYESGAKNKYFGQAGQQLTDEQEFLSWKLSGHSGSNDLLSELSPAINRVMPKRSADARDSAPSDVFDENADYYESCQSLNVMIPASCDSGSIPDNIGGSSCAEEDERRFSSLCFDSSSSNFHSKSSVGVDVSQDFGQELLKHSFTESGLSNHETPPCVSSVLNSSDVFSQSGSSSDCNTRMSPTKDDLIQSPVVADVPTVVIHSSPCSYDTPPDTVGESVSSDELQDVFPDKGESQTGKLCNSYPVTPELQTEDSAMKVCGKKDPINNFNDNRISSRRQDMIRSTSSNDESWSRSDGSPTVFENSVDELTTRFECTVNTVEGPVHPEQDLYGACHDAPFRDDVKNSLAKIPIADVDLSGTKDVKSMSPLPSPSDLRNSSSSSVNASLFGVRLSSSRRNRVTSSSSATSHTSDNCETPQTYPEARQGRTHSSSNSPSEFFSDSGKSLGGLEEDNNVLSDSDRNDSSTYAELLRSRATRSEPPDSLRKPAAGTYVTRASAQLFPSSVGNYPLKHTKQDSFDSIKERRKPFESRGLKTASNT